MLRGIMGNYIDIKQAATYLGFAEQTLYHWNSTGKLKAFKVGRACRYTIKQLDDFMNRENDKYRTVE